MGELLYGQILRFVEAFSRNYERSGVYIHALSSIETPPGPTPVTINTTTESRHGKIKCLWQCDNPPSKRTLLNKDGLSLEPGSLA